MVEELEESHIRYLEATYHLSHPGLVEERRRLLESANVILSDPWVEAPPRYELSPRRYEQIDLGVEGLPALLGEIAPFNPPYAHQAQGVEAYLRRQREIVVATGTGSGKTEVFLFSIIGHLLAEARRGRTTQMRSCRALVLYPMNALVSDQLARIRKLLGQDPSASKIRTEFGRTVQFAMYTGRTPYHGVYDPDKNNRRVGPALRKLEDLRGTQIFNELAERGRVPAKDIPAFIRHQGPHKYRRFRTAPTDAELYTRQEVLSPRAPETPGAPNYNPHGGTPDILITNYSMLEYTLLRPIEQTIWDDVRTWLNADEENTLLIVLDEAHLYRGAQGTEISLLLARFANHLRVPRSKLRFILTSASVGTPTGGDAAAQEFAASLTNGRPENFEIIRGQFAQRGPTPDVPAELCNELRGWSPAESPEDARAIAIAWGLRPREHRRPSTLFGEALKEAPWFDTVVGALDRGATTISRLSATLWPTQDEATRRQATTVLLSSLSWATQLVRDSNGRTRETPLLPLRLHLLVRGIPGLFACLNPECSEKLASTATPTGRLYTAPVGECRCGARVFELWSHRDCGASYIHAYRASYSEPGRPVFLWASEQVIDEDLGQLQPLVLLLEQPTHADYVNTPPSYLGVTTGLLANAREELHGEDAIPVWEATQRTGNSYVNCPACGQSGNPGGSQSGERQPFGNIMDLQTKGEAPFANLVRTLFEQQPPAWSAQEAADRHLPNRGKKVLCFSDSRQKAARLARDMQRTVERDSFREILTLAISEANRLRGDRVDLESYYVQVFESALTHELSLFDTRGRQEFSEALRQYRFLRTVFSPEAIEAEQMDQFRGMVPMALHAALLRALSDTHYSLQATMLATPRAHDGILATVRRVMSSRGHVDDPRIDALIHDLLLRCVEEAAVNPQISPDARRSIGPWFRNSRDGDFGIPMTDIFPRELLRADRTLSEQFLNDLSEAVRLSGLIVAGTNGRFFINPKRFWLRLTAENEAWGQCTVCRRPTPLTHGRICPWVRCRGPVREVDTSYAPLAARKDLFRRPALRVAHHERPPYTLRAEEHTAQLNAYQEGELHGRAERYELLFQDILVESTDDPQPRAIDVLSCTTTMEVGIDIGSITAVALRTVPPRPDNYQQRAGRAGRRGTAVSTILTFADLSPYEQFVFENPERILVPEPLAPILHTSNENIVERHLFAALFQAFFFRDLPNGVTWRQRITQNAQLFESLGTMESFFHPDAPHDYDFPAFALWLDAEVRNGWGGAAARVADLVPDVPEPSRMHDPQAFVRRASQKLVEKLSELARQPMRHPDEAPISFLEALIRANLRPAFGFPLDLATFSVRGKLHPADQANRIQYEPQQDLQVALTEYAPGRGLVIDKNDFVSHGLHVGFPQDPLIRAADIPWDDLNELVQCSACESVLSFDARGIQVATCEACGSPDVHVYPFLRPDGFSPAVENREWLFRGAQADQDPAAAVAAKLPTPDLRDTAVEAVREERVGPFSTLVHAKSQRLVVSNLGVDEEGYTICRDCGTIDPDPGSTSHMRPYPLPPWIQGSHRCANTNHARGTAFAHGFRTDVALLRIVADNTIDYHPASEWFQASAVSLAEAIGIAASRRLRLERGELRAGWRPLQRDTSTGVERIIDIYVYDGTPGGAGFASRAFEHIRPILDDAARLLSTCTCERACNRCILTFDNKHHVELLDRHAGLSLLGYARDGRVADVPAEEQTRLASRLDLLLRRQSPDNSCAADGQGWVVRLGSRSFSLTIRPVLRVGDIPGLAYTDFQMRSNPVAIADQTLAYR